MEARGGNSYFTDGAVRFAYRGIDDVRVLLPDLAPLLAAEIAIGSYTEENYLRDLVDVSRGQTDLPLAETVVRQSFPTMRWLCEQGLQFQLLIGQQAFRVGGRYRFWGGLILGAEGKGVEWITCLFERIQAVGIDVWYGARAEQLLTDGESRVAGVRVRRGAGDYVAVRCGAVVLASGGFEANPEWRARYLGPDWDLARVRGTEFNTGDGIRMALELGAQPYGNWSGCHAVASDLAAPPHGGDRSTSDIFKRHSYPLGILVNEGGERFVDEGADYRNYTYAKYGKEVLRQPNQVAHQIFDAKVAPLLRHEYRHECATRVEADTLEELAGYLGIDLEVFMRTVREFNRAVQDGPFDPAAKDGKRTIGIDPPKSNWALPIDTPPFLGFPVTCGITFTFGGIRIDSQTQVIDTEGVPIPGLFAAGELVGGLFYGNYPGGSGLMAGSVFGRIAGAEAARYAHAASSVRGPSAPAAGKSQSSDPSSM